MKLFGPWMVMQVTLHYCTRVLYNVFTIELAAFFLNLFLPCLAFNFIRWYRSSIECTSSNVLTSNTVFIILRTITQIQKYATSSWKWDQHHFAFKSHETISIYAESDQQIRLNQDTPILYLTPFNYNFCKLNRSDRWYISLWIQGNFLVDFNESLTGFHLHRQAFNHRIRHCCHWTWPWHCLIKLRVYFWVHTFIHRLWDKSASYCIDIPWFHHKLTGNYFEKNSIVLVRFRGEIGLVRVEMLSLVILCVYVISCIFDIFGEF